MENIKKTVGYGKQIFRETKEVYVSTDIDLPDYCPDIRRVLQCSGVPYVESTFTETEKAAMDGIAVFRLLYTSDDGSVHTYETEQRYSAAVRCPTVATTDVLFCTQKYESVRYRAVGPRRVELILVVSVQFELDAVTEMGCFAETSEEIQTKQTEKNGYSLQALAECPFVLEETFSPKNEKLLQSSVISEQFVPVQNEIKIVKDKILIKGTCEAECKCLDIDAQMFFTANESIPFSQILSVPGVQEDDTVQILLRSQRGVFSAHDANECTLRIQMTASVYAYRENRIIAVTDAFSTAGDSTNEYEICRPIDNVFTYFDSVTAEENETVTDELAEDTVIAVVTDAPKLSFRNEKDKITFSGCLPTTVLLHGKNGWHSLHKDILFTAERTMAEYDNVTAHCSSWKQTVTCTKSGEQFLLRADVNYSVFAHSECELKVVRSCSRTAETEPSCGHIGLLFAEKGENIWEIAKENRIAPASVRSANNLNDCETIPENMILLLAKQ